MKNFLPAILLLLTISAAAQSYQVGAIPDSLKKDAKAVLREYEYVLEIKSPGKVVTKEHRVMTILKPAGDEFSTHVSWYDKFTDINSITDVLYDANGKELKKVKKKDMEDRSAVSEGTLADDIRYKMHDFYYRVYPYTVEYQEEDAISGVRGFENWDPLWAPGVPTQHSRYVVIAPKDYEVRFRPVNCNFEPQITTSGDKKIYTWEISNLVARKTEVDGPKWREICPYVMIAPSDFEVQGYKGNMSTWEAYGKFINELRAGRDVLPEDIKKKVHQLTDTLTDPRQKIYVLYDFLQKNTRYISIQLGIGGWQPFPADYVAAKRYGDCKALSNYMIALLKEAGITGKYVEIRSGRNAADLMDDFPCSQFDHVVCCVPQGKDTIWLECTSQSESPGFMGSFTGGRKALLIDETGGHVVHTPVYTAADNSRRRVIDAEINEQGDLSAAVKTTYTGIEEEMPHALMNEISEEERKKYLNDLFNLPTYSVDNSHYEEDKGSIPVVREYLHVSSAGYATVSGRRLFIVPNLFDRSNLRLPSDSVRKYDFVERTSFTNIDSITIKIPPGYQAESLPEPVNINSKFGKYASSVVLSPDKIIYYRKWEESVQRFPPSDYAALVRFYEKLYKADHSRIVLVKKE